MFIDFMPIVIAIVVITTGPLVIGLVLRLLGLRLPARIAAALSMIVCVGFSVLIGLGGGDGWPFVIVQFGLAVALWMLSPLEARTLTGQPADDPPAV